MLTLQGREALMNADLVLGFTTVLNVVRPWLENAEVRPMTYRDQEEALEYALQFSRGLETGLADRFVGMYVNDHTTDMAPEVLEAGQRLLDMGFSAGLIPRSVRLEFV